MVSDALTILNRKRVIEFRICRTRLPTIYELSSLVRDGGLMSYGPDQSAIGDRAADFVARILRGARPADLPLEQPTKFKLLMTSETAKVPSPRTSYAGRPRQRGDRIDRNLLHCICRFLAQS